MLLSEKKNFLFIHVPKAAGTSVVNALQPWALQPSNGVWNKVLSRSRLRRDWRKYLFRVHGNLAYAQRRLPESVYRQMYKFAFVRNPWDRLVSEYEFILHHDNHPRHQRVKALGDFAAFLRYELERDKRDQVRMVTDLSGKIGVDFIGRMENLQTDFAHICEHLQIDAQLPHLNQTRHRDYRQYYNSATRDYVAQNWGHEAAAFGYEFAAMRSG